MIHNRSKSKFKKLGLARAFDLWSGGHPAEFIPALRSCEASDVSDDRNIRKRFSDLKKLMERLEADLRSTDSFIENTDWKEAPWGTARMDILPSSTVQEEQDQLLSITIIMLGIILISINLSYSSTLNSKKKRRAP